MLHGDISNMFAPTIVIDVDGLILFQETKFFGLSKSLKLNYNSIKVCEHHLRQGRMIYLLAHRDNESEAKQIEDLLDNIDFPYNKLFHILDGDKREAILSRDHVYYYFYLSKLHGATANKRKEKQILNIAETIF